MAVNRLGRLGRFSGIWLDMATRSQNQDMLGHPGAIRMILLYGESCNFSTTLPNMADGGKVYAFRSYPGRLSASTAVARRSGTSDTSRGNLWLNLVANKSILGRCHLLHIDLWKEKPSVWMVWPSLGSLSATTFSQPGMCQALESLVSWYTRSRFSIVGHKVGPTSCLLPCLCMTLLWYCRLLLSCLGKGLGTLLKPERLLLVLDNLYAACFPEGTRFLLQCARLSERPTLLLMRL